LNELGLILIAAILSGIAVAAAAHAAFRPTIRLAPRLRPYTAVSRSLLGGAVAPLDWGPGQGVLGNSSLLRLFGPLLIEIARRVGSFLEWASDEQLDRKIRQAGMFTRAAPARRVQEYRVRQILTAVSGAAAAGALGAALARPTLMVLALIVAGFAGGAAYWRSRIDRAIEVRRVRMEIELYTINQQLALRVRIGGGVVSAVRDLVNRGRGAIVEELREALQLIRGGMPASRAFGIIADGTPEPHAARMYQVLATAEERGSDLAGALLALSEDIRDDRREALRRLATKRRAAMLIPIVGLMAPIMILFVAAPLPWIVFKGLGS